jgi:hypothetical protein
MKGCERLDESLMELIFLRLKTNFWLILIFLRRKIWQVVWRRRRSMRYHVAIGLGF